MSDQGNCTRPHYHTERGAMAMLRLVRRHGGQAHQGREVYRCTVCFGQPWHLTPKGKHA